MYTKIINNLDLTTTSCRKNRLTLPPAALDLFLTLTIILAVAMATMEDKKNEKIDVIDITIELPSSQYTISYSKEYPTISLINGKLYLWQEELKNYAELENKLIALPPESKKIALLNLGKKETIDVQTKIINICRKAEITKFQPGAVKGR